MSDDYGRKYYVPRGRFPMTTFDKIATRKEINKLAYESGHYIMANDEYIAKKIFKSMKDNKFSAVAAFYNVLNEEFGTS